MKKVDFNYLLKQAKEPEGHPYTICGPFEAMTVSSKHKFAPVASVDLRTVKRYL